MALSVGSCVPLVVVFHRAHLVQVVGAFGGCPRFRAVFPAFCPLSCSSLGALLANMAPFRVFRGFLEGFMGFVWVCVTCALCVACVGFCARVELGG